LKINIQVLTFAFIIRKFESLLENLFSSSKLFIHKAKNKVFRSLSNFLFALTKIEFKTFLYLQTSACYSMLKKFCFPFSYLLALIHMQIPVEIEVEHF
jgi:hypothetical protein